MLIKCIIEDLFKDLREDEDFIDMNDSDLMQLAEEMTYDDDFMQFE